MLAVRGGRVVFVSRQVALTTGLKPTRLVSVAARPHGYVDEALEVLSPGFDGIYALAGRPSIAPGKLLRALLLQAFCSIRSERQLTEQLDDNLLFRWFVGLAMDAP